MENNEVCVKKDWNYDDNKNLLLQCESCGKPIKIGRFCNSADHMATMKKALS